MQLRVVANFVSVDKFKVDRIGLRRNWIEYRSNLAPSTNTQSFNLLTEIIKMYHS